MYHVIWKSEHMSDLYRDKYLFLPIRDKYLFLPIRDKYFHDIFDVFD